MKVQLSSAAEKIVQQISNESSFGKAMSDFNDSVKNVERITERISKEKKLHNDAIILIDEKYEHELMAANETMRTLQAKMYQEKASSANSKLFALLETERGKVIMNRAFRIPEMESLAHYLLFTGETHQASASILYRHVVVNKQNPNDSAILENASMSLDQLNDMLNEDSAEITVEKWLDAFSTVIRDQANPLQSATLSGTSAGNNLEEAE